MARVYFELSDFARLVQEIANRRRPLLSKTFSHGPRPMQVHLDVTLYALETIECEGPITAESMFQPGETWIKFNAEVPRLNLKFPCTLKRGTLLIKDGDWPLEINFQCSVTGQIHLVGGPGDEPIATTPQRHVQVAFKNFQIRCKAFPHWLEHPMQRILERMLESIIGEMVPIELRRPFTSSPGELSDSQTAAEVQQAPTIAERRQAGQSSAAYWPAYYLAYGLTFPAACISGLIYGTLSRRQGCKID
jgi:hypothetical protein